MAARFDDDAQHGPQISQRPEQSDCAKLCDVFVRIGMVEPELVTVIVLPWLPLLQQHTPACVMQLPVMKDDEPGISGQYANVFVAGALPR